MSRKKTNKILSFDDINKINQDLNNSKNHQLSFSNYPELCNYLNIPVCGGEQKKNQLKKLNYYLNLKQLDDNSFILSEAIFSLMDYDKNDLKELTEYTILSYILYQHKKDNQKCTVSLSYLAEMLGYITLKYKYFYSHPKELSEKTNIPISNVYEFFEKTNDLYHRYILDSLENLEKYKFLSSSKQYYGIEYVVENKGKLEKTKTVYGDYEEVLIPEITENCRPLSDKEIAHVLQIEEDSFFETIGFYNDFNKTTHDPEEIQYQKSSFLDELKQQNISLLSYLFSHRLEKKFFAIRHRKLVEEMNLSSAYKTYDIVYRYDRIYTNFQFIYNRLMKDVLNINDLDSKCILDEKNIFYNASSQIVETSSKKLLENTQKRHQREKNKILDSDPDKLNIQNIIDRETKEFKQMLDLLIYQQKNYDENFKQFSKNNYLLSSDFDNIFSDNLSSLSQKNEKFLNRNKNISDSDKYKDVKKYITKKNASTKNKK